MVKVYVDAGHGGTEPGAIGVANIKEEDVNLAVANYLKTELERQNISVKMSRTSDVSKTISVRASEANSWGADIVCSIHANSYKNETANGTEVLIYKKGGNAEKIAVKVLENLVATLKTTDRGVKERSDLGILRKTTAPAILCELAFLSNKADKEKVDEVAEQKACAVAICKGICSYLGITYKKEETKVAKTKFKDEATIPSWALDSVKKVAGAGIMLGDDKGNFRPNDSITRAEFAVAIARAFKL